MQSEEMRAHLHEVLQPDYGDNAMSLGTILLIILVIILLGGFSGLAGARSTGPAITVAAGSAS